IFRRRGVVGLPWIGGIGTGSLWRVLRIWLAGRIGPNGGWHLSPPIETARSPRKSPPNLPGTAGCRPDRITGKGPVIIGGVFRGVGNTANHVGKVPVILMAQDSKTIEGAAQIGGRAVMMGDPAVLEVVAP